VINHSLMRLLKIKDNADLSLEEFMNESELPKYAILSHRWGDDSDEVTKKDVQDEIGKTKIIYEKILRCAKQVVEDSLKLI
jgi:hypothetical protein